jgi:hypothetical protein
LAISPQHHGDNSALTWLNIGTMMVLCPLYDRVGVDVKEHDEWFSIGWGVLSHLGLGTLRFL